MATAEVDTVDNTGHTAADHIQVGYRLPAVEHCKPQPCAQIPQHICPSDKTAYKTSSQSPPSVSPCYPSSRNYDVEPFEGRAYGAYEGCPVPAKTNLDTAKSDSDDEEEYAFQRNKFGAPIYGPKPAQYLNCNDLMDRSLALQAVLNPFRKVCVWKKVVSFLGSLPVPLQHVDWKPDYTGCFNKKEEGDGQWHAEIRLTDLYGNIYDQ
ncbi:hypothetical protein Tco_0073658 [Tanacetum coccineum]